jgi:hypothetical protein
MNSFRLGFDALAAFSNDEKTRSFLSLSVANGHSQVYLFFKLIDTVPAPRHYRWNRRGRRVRQATRFSQGSALKQMARLTQDSPHTFTRPLDGL